METIAVIWRCSPTKWLKCQSTVWKTENAQQDKQMENKIRKNGRKNKWRRKTRKLNKRAKELGEENGIKVE